MSFLFPVVLLLIFGACLGFLYTEGMWGNAIRLINVIFAALLATNFWEPLARMLENNVSASFSYFWDFLALWGLFCVFLVVFRIATGFASKVKVRFKGIVDRIGAGAFAALLGWVMVCFVTMTLHTAPLAPRFLFGGFKPGEKMFIGLAPDQQWLAFTEWMSKGSFSRWQPRVFDPNHEFIPKYEERRTNLDKHLESAAGVRDILVSAGSVPAR